MSPRSSFVARRNPGSAAAALISIAAVLLPPRPCPLAVCEGKKGIGILYVSPLTLLHLHELAVSSLSLLSRSGEPYAITMPWRSLLNPTPSLPCAPISPCALALASDAQNRQIAEHR